MTGRNLAVALGDRHGAAALTSEPAHGTAGDAAPVGPELTIVRLRADLPPAPLEREWDAFVDAAPDGDLVQTTAWGRSKLALGFSAALAVSRDALGRIDGGGLVIGQRISLVGGRLPLATVGYVARGPLVDSSDEAMIERVLDALEATARLVGVIHLIVQPPDGGSAIAALLLARGYVDDAPPVAPTCTLMIDLTPEIDDLFAAMSKSRRRDLAKAKKLGVIVRRATVSDLPVFHALHVGTAKRQGFRPLSLDYLTQQWRLLRPLGAVEIFLVSSPDTPERPIAGSLVTAYGGTVTYKLAGWTGEAPMLQPNIASIWEAILWAKATGYRRFDLGGIDRTAGAALSAGERDKGSHGERNPFVFKARFGGSVVMLPLAHQRTFNPLLGAGFRLAWRQLARNSRLQRFLGRLRSG